MHIITCHNIAPRGHLSSHKYQISWVMMMRATPPTNQVQLPIQQCHHWPPLVKEVEALVMKMMRMWLKWCQVWSLQFCLDCIVCLNVQTLNCALLRERVDGDVFGVINHSLIYMLPGLLHTCWGGTNVIFECARLSSPLIACSDMKHCILHQLIQKKPGNVIMNLWWTLLWLIRFLLLELC